MNLGSNEGDFQYETKEGIIEHIKRSSALPLDDISISGENEFPCLSILINGNYACVHFFEKEGVMWQSFSNFTRKIIFMAGGVEWEAPADTVISIESAILCAIEFFDTMKKPICIEWQEL